LENEEGGLHSQIAKLQDSINSTQDKIANDQLKEEELSDEIAKMRDQMVSIKKILAEYESVGTSD
jgi:predicted  nucleic acid-binding Zn-ribbon protein